MGYALLWIESLLVSLLATAAWLAWVCCVCGGGGGAWRWASRCRWHCCCFMWWSRRARWCFGNKECLEERPGCFRSRWRH